VVLFARIRRIPLWSLGDFVMSGLPLGHALGRLGCFLNGCCYGMPTQCLCGVVYPENSAPWYRFGHAPLHPTQLYEAAFNLLLYLFFLWYYPRRRRQGNVVALYLLLYPLARFLNEWLRGDERLKWMGLSLAQEISVLLFLTGLVLWFSLPRNIRRDWP
jgi:phosphatidylglycerol:prolipoprotein diacylglycerol transferase